MEHIPFSLEMSVRDYECDMQGVVNNAVYQNYLEHARHEYLKSIGIDFAALAAQGINLVVTRVEIDYRFSLTSGDRFTVEVRPERISKVRMGFRQAIRRIPDGREVISALVTGTALNPKGRPQLPKELDEVLGKL
ncbi:thioesterase family protein [Geobacter sp. DSM 9736]|uniref:acyl-CoA thioesterase n=1 Tax=Geobacter sp. DSM 9736 TaxID=1277350 RepID=UPI000B5105CD|nr:acyl-CoA thioesterase [Geobacter sp. DSM 9736]SNB46738.1 acyl-CoA thioester hydrolase [Geobacter sp. DSM 9736]